MKKALSFLTFLLFAFTATHTAVGQTFTIISSDRSHISLHFDLGDFRIDTVMHEGEVMHTITTKGIVAPNDYGLPALPTFNRFIAIPQGSKAIVEVRTRRSQRMTGINITPSEGSQAESEPERPFFKDSKVYATNAFYPAESYMVAEPQRLRGVDVIHLGLSPFQYNPVTHELAVNRELDIDIRFEGGNGHFGDDRLRSPYWDPILQNNILNYSSLPDIDYHARRQEWTRDRLTGCEYLILTPNNDAFISAAQELANYRIRQGIFTKVMSIGETGATTTMEIRQWFRDIYNSWDIPPVAVCILADHGEDMDLHIPAYHTLHPIEDFVNTDNPYADIDDDRLPDMCFSRLVANDESELPIFIGKQIEYEYTAPVSNLAYYSHPLTAAAWQNTSWFQICIATISGYLTQHGKQPIRVNEIYNGELGTAWSTAANTSAVTDYFGPNGLGYIPATPAELGGWTGGNAGHVIHAINSGAYLIQHRDHGWTQKWYQPEIYVSDFGDINNPGKMSFLISVNCKTGQFDYNGNCFTEGLIRMTRDGQNAGIVGAISPSGRTYSFANDIYLWGVWDLFDPEFLPDYGPYASHVAQWMPSFANVSGKYFLEQNVFPNADMTMRNTTFNAYHSHCDAFLRLYTEMPQTIEATHDPYITIFTPFHITVPEGVEIALSANYGHKDHLLATATGTGQDQVIYVMDYIPTSTVCLTMTGLNFIRSEILIPVAPLDRPLVVADSVAFNQGATHLHHGESATVDLVVRNVGASTSASGSATIANTTGQLQITQASTTWPPLAPDETALIGDAFQVSVSSDVPDGTNVPFTITTQFNGESFEREFDLAVIAPNIKAELLAIDDHAGNGNGYLDAGEFASLTFRLANHGHYIAQSPHIALLGNEDYIRVITPEQTLDNMPIGATVDLTFDIFVEFLAGEAPSLDFTLTATCQELVMENSFSLPLGFSMESFEIGEFNPMYWVNDPHHPWQIVDIGAYHGNYCAQSDTTITHDEASHLIFNYTSNAEGTLSFFCKVSSENNYDFLVFSVDSVMLDRWSGTVAWYEHTYTIQPGSHQYQWNYTKDYSVSNGEDCAWIDYITLPPYLDATDEKPDLPLDLHPNPTTGQIHIDLDLDSDFTVQVFDSHGKLVMTTHNTQIITLEGMAPGLFHIIVEKDCHRWSRRIIKM